MAVARDEVRQEEATLTSATVLLERGPESGSNTGYACTSGRVLAVQLIGSFPHIVTTGMPSSDSGKPRDFTVRAVLLKADATSGRVCQISVQTDVVTPEAAAVPLDLG